MMIMSINSAPYHRTHVTLINSTPGSHNVRQVLCTDNKRTVWTHQKWQWLGEQEFIRGHSLQSMLWYNLIIALRTSARHTFWMSA